MADRAEVYRCYDADGILLYIGSSRDAFVRASQHRRRTDWGAAIAEVRVVPYKTRWDADEAEAAAIRAEKPLHNIMSNPEAVARSSVGGRKFDPTPAQDAAIRAVWLDEARSLADRCQAVIDICGARVPRFTLYRRYGKPGAPRMEG